MSLAERSPYPYRLSSSCDCRSRLLLPRLQIPSAYRSRRLTTVLTRVQTPPSSFRFEFLGLCARVAFDGIDTAPCFWLDNTETASRKNETHSSPPACPMDSSCLGMRVRTQSR